jgi:hypothetical protein
MARLSPEFQVVKEENPSQIAKADLAVGFLAKNDEPTIARIATTLSEGQAMDFPETRTALILSDCNSTDKTVETFFNAPTDLPKIVVVAPQSERQQTQALFNLLIVAERLGAKYVVVQNADTLTVKRTWLKRLINPLAEGVADFTNPLYSRNAIDAPVTNLMVYPLFRALFGRRLRQPILTDWAFGDGVLKALLARNDWPDRPGAMAPELMVKATAVTSGFRVCQSIMTEGRYGLSNQRMDTDHIIGMFKELAHGLFELMAIFRENWRVVSRSKPTSVVGTDLKPGLFPVRYEVRLEELFGEIKDLRKDAEADWRDLLPNSPGDLGHYLATVSLADLDVDAQKWGSLLFYCGNLYDTLNETDKSRLLTAMTPVFLARILSFQKQTLGLSATQVEAQVEEAAMTLEKLKKNFTTA